MTKIKIKYTNNGKIYLRFPQGLLIPKYLKQKAIDITEINKKNKLLCEINNCKNLKKYKDPKTQLYYCSVDCYKQLKNQII